MCIFAARTNISHRFLSDQMGLLSPSCNNTVQRKPRRSSTRSIYYFLFLNRKKFSDFWLRTSGPNKTLHKKTGSEINVFCTKGFSCFLANSLRIKDFTKSTPTNICNLFWGTPKGMIKLNHLIPQKMLNTAVQFR